MELLDLSPFTSFIKTRKLVPEKYVSYYVSWVRRYLQAEIPAVVVSDKDRLRFFCEQLERDTRIQDWQIDQARRAVELYFNVYRKEQSAACPTVHPVPAVVPPSPARPPATAEDACVRMQELLRVRHYSIHTERTYLDWVRRFMDYTKANRLDWQSDGVVRSYLAYLATTRDVASSTQNQAFNALLFLNREVLKRDIGDMASVRARRGTKLPVVLSVDEVRAVLKAAPESARLMLELTYGAGLRVSETIRLRVKDLDFDNHLVFVRAGKGDKDRSTLLPKRLDAPLKAQIERVKALHADEL